MATVVLDDLNQLQRPSVITACSQIECPSNTPLLTHRISPIIIHTKYTKLALKKKREAEAKAKAEEAALAAANGGGGSGAVQTPGTAPSAAATTNEESKKVSLLGVGGKKKQTGAGGPKQKKRSPGEIRIQKGEREGLCMLIVFLLGSRC